MQKRRTALIIGPVPPPLGGMASVVQGSLDVLNESDEFEPVCVDFRRKQDRTPGALSLDNVKMNLALTKDLKRSLRKHDPAVVHLHASVAKYSVLLKNLLLAGIVRRRKVPLIVQAHSGYIEKQLARGDIMWEYMMGKLLASADIVLNTSGYWTDLLESRWPGLHYRELANNVDTDFYVPLSSDKQDAALEVMFLGHIAHYKGLAELAEAWRRISPQFPQVRLNIVGEPKDSAGRELHEELKNLPNVKVYGAVENMLKLRLLQTCSVFVLPSHFENQPIALMEAMACGRCCIASSVGAVPEMLAGGCGLLCEPADAASLENVLKLALRDSVLRKETGARARQRIVDRYSQTAYRSAIHELYRDAAAMHRR